MKYVINYDTSFLMPLRGKMYCGDSSIKEKIKVKENEDTFSGRMCKIINQYRRNIGPFWNYGDIQHLLNGSKIYTVDTTRLKPPYRVAGSS